LGDFLQGDMLRPWCARDRCRSRKKPLNLCLSSLPFLLPSYFRWKGKYGWFGCSKTSIFHRGWEHR